MAAGKREGEAYRERLRSAKPRAGTLSRVFLRLYEAADRDKASVIGESHLKHRKRKALRAVIRERQMDLLAIHRDRGQGEILNREGIHAFTAGTGAGNHAADRLAG